MGKSFYDNYKEGGNYFDRASEVLGFDLANLCFKGPLGKLTEAEKVQPAILTVSVICFKIFQKEIKFKPDYLLGHSFGELSALACSEAISFSDAIYIAKLKGQEAKKAIKNKETEMALVKNINRDELEELCRKHSDDKERVVIAVLNTAKQITIAGDKNAVEKVKTEAIEKGGEAETLKTSAPFHSPLLEPGVEKIKTEMAKFDYNNFAYPVISCLNNKIYKNKNDIIKNISESFVRPVRWEEVILGLENKNINTALEMGPQKILTNLIPEISDNIKTYNFNSTKDIETLKESFPKKSEKNNKDIIIKCLKIAVCLKNNNHNEKEYQEKVVKPYNKVHQRLLELEESGQEPRQKDVDNAVLMLEKVFKYKKINNKEISKRKEELNL